MPRGVGQDGPGALPESEALYRSLIETSPDGITVADLQGRLLLTNRRAAEMHGFLSPDEYLADGEPGTDWIAPRDRARAQAEMRRIIEEGSIRCIEYELVRRDGTTYPAEVNACLIRDAQGRPVGILGIARDISERRRAEEELLRAQRLEALGQGRRFDAVVLDLTIPGGMGGLETLRRLRELDPDVRAIVASGYSDDPVMAEPERHGFRGVVPKPFGIRQLGDALCRLLQPA